MDHKPGAPARAVPPRSPSSPTPSGAWPPPKALRDWPGWLRETPGAHLLLLRAFLGVTFTFAGLQKLANRGFFTASDPGSIQTQIEASAHSTPVGSLLAPTIHIAVALGIIIAFTELAVGLATLLGLYSRVAAIIGMLLALSFFLTVSYNTTPYYYGSDIVFLFAWTTLALGGAGALSFDAYFVGFRERQRRETAGLAAASAAGRAPTPRAVDRRTAIAKLATGGLTGVAVVFFGGIAAATGRMFGHNQAAGSNVPVLNGGTAVTTTTANGGSGTTSPPSTRTGSTEPAPKGQRLGPAAAVLVGGAAQFTDTAQGIPAYVVQPSTGEFLGFSRICTHAGCTVNFVKAARQFQCPCHGSIYSAVTGAVIQGPAPLPLPRIRIVNSGGELYAED